MRMEATTFLALIAIPLLFFWAVSVPQAHECPDVRTGWPSYDSEKDPDCVAEAEASQPVLYLIGALFLLDIYALYRIGKSHTEEKMSYGWRPIDYDVPTKISREYPRNNPSQYESQAREVNVQSYLKELEQERANLYSEVDAQVTQQITNANEIGGYQEKIEQLNEQIEELKKSKTTTIIIQDRVVSGDVVVGNLIKKDD